MKVRRSRKKYIPLYIMVLALILFILFLRSRGFEISRFAMITSIIFIFLVLKFSELHRFKDWWAVSENKLVQSMGIFDKNVREIGFSSISDLDVHQPFFKRVLGYGTVNVRLFLNETSIKIPDINRPERFVETLQGLMSNSGGKNGGIRLQRE